MDQENNDNTMHEPMGDTQSPVVSAQQSDSAQGQQAEATQTTNDGISDHKMYAILGYILPFLFFLPLLSESSKNNPFARFHANQQLILLIILVAIHFVLNNIIFMVLGPIWYMFMPLLNLAVLVLVILGVINAAQGTMKELPVVGKFRILK
jgi:uncharacterized membrane protein